MYKKRIVKRRLLKLCTGLLPLLHEYQSVIRNFEEKCQQEKGQTKPLSLID